MARKTSIKEIENKIQEMANKTSVQEMANQASIQEIEKRIQELDDSIEKCSSIIDSGNHENDYRHDRLKDKITMLERELDTCRNMLPAMVTAQAMKQVEDKSNEIIGQTQKDFDEKLMSVKQKIKEVEILIASINETTDQYVKNKADAAVEKAMSGGLKEEISKSVSVFVKAILSDTTRQKVEEQLRIAEAGEEQEKIVMSAIQSAITSIGDEIVERAKGLINPAFGDEKEEKIEPLDRQKEHVHQSFDKLQVILEAGVIPFLVGPAGTGKSTVCEQVARAMGLKFYCANRVQNSYDLTGYRNAAGVFESV